MSSELISVFPPTVIVLLPDSVSIQLILLTTLSCPVYKLIALPVPVSDKAVDVPLIQPSTTLLLPTITTPFSAYSVFRTCTTLLLLPVIEISVPALSLELLTKLILLTEALTPPIANPFPCVPSNTTLSIWTIPSLSIDSMLYPFLNITSLISISVALPE